MGVLQTSIYVFIFLCKLNYKNNKFMHTPMYTYIEVMQLLEFVMLLNIQVVLLCVVVVVCSS